MTTDDQNTEGTAPEEAAETTAVREDESQPTTEDAPRTLPPFEDDDEEFLASSDEAAVEEPGVGAFVQGDEDFMAWSIEGLYDPETEKVYRKRFLRQNPPMLHIENRREGTTHYADFLLTRGVAQRLESEFRTINRAYSGVYDSPPLSKAGLVARKDLFLEWCKEHVVGLSVFFGVIAFIVVFGIIL